MMPNELSPPGSLGSFRNREEFSFAVRVIGGWFPLLILMVFAYGLLLSAWLIDPGSLPIAAILLGWSAAAAMGAVWLFHTLRMRTPTRIELGSSEVTAIWSGRSERRVTIPFRQISSIGRKSWIWQSEGKGSHYVFTPASIQFGGRFPEESGRGSPEGMDQDVIYLTDENLRRVQSAFDEWGGPETIAQGNPLIETSEGPDSLPPGWVNCARCGAPLKRHVEREAGLCSSCLRSNAKQANGP